MNRKLKALIVTCVFIALIGLWLKELSQRLAREEADLFMGPFLTEYTCNGIRFMPFYHEGDGKGGGRWFGPAWCVSYDSHKFLVDFPPQVNVVPFGGVRSVYNLKDFNSLIGLSYDARYNKESQMLKEIDDIRKKRKANSGS